MASVKMRQGFSLKRLFINRSFGLLWTGQTISELGSHITGYGLPIAALLVLDAGPLQMAFLAILEALPMLIVGLFAGVWVDRLPRRPILIAADLLRALLLLSIPFAAITGTLRIEQLYIVAVLAGVLTVFFRVADQSFLPSILKRDELLVGNSRLGASSSLAEVIGPTLAGWLVQVLTAPIAVLLDALSFLVSALCIGLIPRRRMGEEMTMDDEESRQIRQHFWREMRAGMTMLLQHPLLRPLTLLTCTRDFFAGTFYTLYSIYVIRELGATPLIFGIMIAIGGIGAIVGSVIATQVTKRLGVGRTMIGCTVILGLLCFLNPLASGPWPHTVGLGLLMLSQLGDINHAIYDINEVSLLQASVPSHILGRVTASKSVLAVACMIVGTLSVGFLSSVMTTQTLFTITAFGMLGASAWLIFSPLRHLKTLPESSEIQQ